MNPLHRPLLRTHKRLRTALLVGAALVATPAAAATTDISQVPMAVKNTVAPNIMFTLDDSKSMYGESLPGAEITHLFPRASNPYGTVADFEWITANADPDDPNARFFRSAAGNPLFYNPAIRYEPWRDADGNPWPDAVPAAASMNSGNPVAPTLDLTAEEITATAAYLLLGGVIPANQVVSFRPATYFVYDETKGGGPLTRFGATNHRDNFKHVEILPAGVVFDGRNKYPQRTDCGETSCSYQAEIQNFANWFSYHRSRLLAARAAIGSAFSQQGTNLRVGFATINSPLATIDGASTGRVVRGVRPFAGDARTEFFELLYSHPVEVDETPLRAAADDIGLYFSRTDAHSPWRQSMTASASPELSCFKNYHILMTDGYWSSKSGHEARAEIHGDNVDNTAGPTHTNADGTTSVTYAPEPPYADGWSGTLADVAMYYWKNDLRPDLANNVRPDARNPAFWQHLSTYTVGFGVSGTLDKTLIDSAFTDSPLDFNWPDPSSSEAAKLDDLAHAAVNGRGGFFNTSDPLAFATELSTMLRGINALLTSSSASAVSNPNIAADNDNDVTYETSYMPGQWTGDLRAYRLDVTTGAPMVDKPAWQVDCPTTSAPDRKCEAGAASLLDERTPVSRKIVTYDGTAGIPFQAGAGGVEGTLLSQLQVPSGTDNAADVLAYLRGERSNEKTIPPTLRPRMHLLGAIVHSEPVLVRAPDKAFADTGYADFRAAKASRPRMLYVGANDGMLHAFNAQTGAEKWAYVPNSVFPRLATLATPDSAFQATVDGYLTVADVDFNNAYTQGTATADWRTLLVGSLGRGGKGIFALDVTDPIAADEAALKNKVLWEFPNASTSAEDRDKFGLAFSRPIIVKHEIVNADGTREGEGWVVLVSSGYNNVDGGGYLFVLDARNGAVLATIATDVGTSSDPSGLGQISAWVDNDNVNSVVRWVYGGDLAGNLWRFDLTGAKALWSKSLLASFTSPSGDAQPITVAPELSRIKADGALYNLVAVGTGLYLGDSDVPGTDAASATASQIQSFYVLADGIDGGALSTIDRSDLVPRTLSALGTDGKRTLATGDALNWAQDKGWYVDFNLAGERVVTDPAIANTTLVFVSNVPNPDPCVPGGSSHLFQLDLVTGSYPVGVTYLSEKIGNTLATRPVLVKLPSGKIVALIRKSDGSTIVRKVPTPPSGGNIRRLSWRELNYR